MVVIIEGVGSTQIAEHVGLSQRSIGRWLNAEQFPENQRRRKRRSKFDPYAAYVLKRWEERCHNGLQLVEEIKAQGYTGSERMVYRFLVPLRRKQRIIQKAVVPRAPLQDFSTHEAVWFFARDPSDLDEEELATLTAICQASETAKITYQLVQESFVIRHIC